MAQKLKLWLPAFLWMGVIFMFSSLPINHEKQFSWTDFILKKTAHVIEYAILYWLIWRAVSQKGQKQSARVFIISFILALAYAFSDEWHQTFIPGREGKLRDIGFDSLGMLLALTGLKKQT